MVFLLALLAGGCGKGSDSSSSPDAAAPGPSPSIVHTQKEHTADLQALNESESAVDDAADDEARITALESYIAAGEAYLAKYSKPFYILKNDGGTETAQLTRDARTELEKKLAAARSELAELKADQDS